jgi:pilus assembly protein CpaE
MIHFSDSPRAAAPRAGRPQSKDQTMSRKVLIVAGAAGPDDVAAGVLQRFGFAPAVAAPDVGAATARLRDELFDLVVVPLQNVEPVELAALEREVRRGGDSSFIIGTAPKADPDLILRAMRAGVHEFLTFPPDLKEFTAAVDRLARRGRTETARGTSFAVHSAKGGLGTTSVALNTAYAIARHAPSARVALADLVVSGGDVRVMLDLKATYDVGDLLARMTRIDAELLTSILTPAGQGVWVLPASERPEVAELVDASASSTIVAQLASHYSYTVLDIEHNLTERTLAALDVVDRVLVVTQLGVVALRSAQRSLELFQRLGYPEDKLAVVVNRYQSNDVISNADAEKLLGRPIFHTIPNDSRTSGLAISQSQSVVGADPNSAIAKSYLSLAAKLTAGAGGVSDGAADATTESTSSSRLGRLFRLGRK